ncbi:MAG: penicillin-binding protein 2, partial [Alphaproteobacteria bacterium]|nr:penicillin-binding protein 2 [Alphaproteobacteria bacterium]
MMTATDTRPAPQGLAGQNRIRLVGLIFSVFFLLITFQLGKLMLGRKVEVGATNVFVHEKAIPRPDIVDRNGAVLATDIEVASLFADPRKISDVDEAVELLTATLPELDGKTLKQRLTTPGKAFVWLKRQTNPEERDAVYNLGIPGVAYVNERKRVYPMGRLAAHTVGYVDVDTKGIAGIEKYLDDQGALYTASLSEPETHTSYPAQLSMDVRVQQAVSDEVAKAVSKFKAKSGGGIVLDTETGEIVALASLPDYNPNAENKNLTSDQQNKLTSGVFELGSVIKAVTFAMAFDNGVMDLNSRYDARAPLVIGTAKINDF